MDLSRHTVTNYARYKTNPGPFRTWGKAIQKETDSTCPDCTIPYEHIGERVAFKCKKYRLLRTESNETLERVG